MIKRRPFLAGLGAGLLLPFAKNGGAGRAFANETYSPKPANAMPTIDKITIFHGNMEPDNPRSWFLNIAKIEAGGKSGWGEAATTYAVSSRGTPAVAKEMAERILLGKNPLENVRLSSGMNWIASGNYDGGMVAYGAMAALDVALWDLKGQLLGEPVHRLLGGAMRRELRTYANGWCYDMTEPRQYADAARRVVSDGFTAMKFDPFRYDPGGFQEHPRPGGNTTRRWMKIGFDRVAAVRKAVGPDIDIILEAHAKFTPDVGIEVCRRAAEYDCLFVEEPIKGIRPDVLRRVADASPVPLAGGERIVKFEDLQAFVDAQAFALAQPDLGVVGGITPSRRMAEYAATRQIQYQSHNSALGLNTAAILQLSATLPNFLIQEVFPYRPDDWYGLLKNPYELRIKDGYCHLDDTPGLGVRVNEDWVRKRLNAIEIQG